MDSCKNYRTDYLYSRKSVPRGILGTLYVWCCHQLLHSYQKFIICFCLVIGFSFPAFAEDERYNFKSIGNEALYLNGYDISVLASPSNFISGNNNNLRSVIISDNTIDSISSRLTSSGNNLIYVNGNGYGFSNRTNATAVINGVSSSPIGSSTDNSLRFVFSEYPVTISNIRLENEDGSFNTFSVNYTFYNPNESFNLTEGSLMTEYLSQVTTVFTWLLTSITSLITFILGNPFLAVSLVLFMCGAVVSFYVRIKNS